MHIVHQQIGLCTTGQIDVNTPRTGTLVVNGIDHAVTYYRPKWQSVAAQRRKYRQSHGTLRDRPSRRLPKIIQPNAAIAKILPCNVYRSDSNNVRYQNLINEVRHSSYTQRNANVLGPFNEKKRRWTFCGTP